MQGEVLPSTLEWLRKVEFLQRSIVSEGLSIIVSNFTTISRVSSISGWTGEITNAPDLSSEACLGYNRHHANCFRTEFYQKQVGGVFDEGLP